MDEGKEGTHEAEGGRIWNGGESTRSWDRGVRAMDQEHKVGHLHFDNEKEGGDKLMGERNKNFRLVRLLKEQPRRRGGEPRSFWRAGKEKCERGSDVCTEDKI